LASRTWSKAEAAWYDTTSAAMFAPAVLDPAVELLFELSAGGPALELAIGTGRVALPLSAKGITVRGIELSAYMAEQLRRKHGGDAVDVTVGDMKSTRIDGRFTLVYLVWNAIMNVTAQHEQVAVFNTAAAHLAPGGCFVVEVGVPDLRGLAQGQARRVFTMEPDRVGIDTFDDLVGQIASSHHWMPWDGQLVYHAAAYRYVWPSELDLMAQLAGLRLRDRWAGWTRAPFTSDSTEQVAVYEKLPDTDPVAAKP
jgi:SAM-dependent methyltransferase